MKKTLAVGLCLFCLSLCGQKIPFSFYYADSLLSETPFQNLDTSSFITTGILWDKVLPNINLLAYQGNSEDTARAGNITSFAPALDIKAAAIGSTILPHPRFSARGAGPYRGRSTCANR